MNNETPSYTSHNFDAMDAQILQMAEREKAVTRSQVLRNNLASVKLIGLFLLALGLFAILLALAYKIAFPKEKVIHERIKINDSINNGESSYIINEKNNLQNRLIEKEKEIITLTNTLQEYKENNLTLEEKVKNQINNDSSDPQEIKTNVTSFLFTRSDTEGYRNVVTGWEYENSTDKIPKEIFCYYEQMNNGVMTQINAGYQYPGEIPILYDWDKSGLITKKLFYALSKKCSWATY